MNDLEHTDVRRRLQPPRDGSRRGGRAPYAPQPLRGSSGSRLLVGLRRNSGRSALRVSTVLVAMLFSGCKDARGGYGIDPAVADRPLPTGDTPVDSALARVGAEVFQDRCVACHKLGPGVAVGPDLLGIVERRDPVWIRGMVLNPDSMLRSDSVARDLLYQYQVPMIDTGIGEPEFRALLEFLRSSGGA